MHELPAKPAGIRLLRWTSVLSLPANSEASFLPGLQWKAIVCELVRQCGFVRSAVPCVLRRGGHTTAGGRAVRAMPSARALLVASLLTEPPCGCLGPSGNDRYRKLALLANGRLRTSTARSQRLFRNESVNSRRIQAGVMGGLTA